MAKGKGRKGTRKAADVKIADTVEKNLDLKRAETLFDELSHVAGKKFRDRMQRVYGSMPMWSFTARRIAAPVSSECVADRSASSARRIKPLAQLDDVRSILRLSYETLKGLISMASRGAAKLTSFETD
jgi:hypothetical protein